MVNIIPLTAHDKHRNISKVPSPKKSLRNGIEKTLKPLLLLSRTLSFNHRLQNMQELGDVVEENEHLIRTSGIS